VESTAQVPNLRPQSPQDVEISSFFHAGPLDFNSLELGPRQNTVVPSSQPTVAQPSRNTTPAFRDLNGKRLIDLTNIRICKDPGPSTEEMPINNQTSDKSLPILPEGVEEGYLELYFAHFHHRWAIIHRPAHHDGNNKLTYKFCMLMIGGWLSGTGEGKGYAVAMYDYLIPHISNTLVSIRSKSNVSQIKKLIRGPLEPENIRRCLPGYFAVVSLPSSGCDHRVCFAYGCK
jgi:hypothetical protein